MKNNYISQAFSNTISLRGRDYYIYGKVQFVRETSPGCYNAIVKGSHCYEVTVTIDDDGNVTYMNCTCPYGNGCKHEAALMYYLQDYSAKPKYSDESSNQVKSLIREYSEKAVRKAESDNSKPIHIEPKFYIVNNSISVSVQIGRERLYSVQSIEQLCNEFKYRTLRKYGKEFITDHNFEQLDFDSKKLLGSLSSICKNSRSVGRRMNISNDDLISLLTHFDGREIVCDEMSCSVSCTDPKLSIVISEKANGYYFTVREQFVILGGMQGVLYFSNEHSFVIGSNSYFDFAMPLIRAILKSDNKMFVHKNEIRAFYVSVLQPLAEYFVFEGIDLLDEYTPPEVQPQLHIDCVNSDTVTAKLNFLYDDKTYSAFIEKGKNPYCNFSAEIEAEALTLKYFRQDNTTDDYNLIARGDNELYKLLSEGVAELSQKLDIFVTDSFKRLVVRPSVCASVGVKLENSLLELNISAENYELSELVEMLNAYRKGKKFHRLRDGSFAQIADNTMGELSDIVSALNVSDRTLLNGQVTVPQYRMMYLNSLQSDKSEIRIKRNAAFKQAVEKFSFIGEHTAEKLPPKSLSSVMRDYQKTGFVWLNTLKEYCFGGILADDMGLGKTIQAISLILDEKEINPDYRTSLVVCPSSLTLNWVSEINRFASSLKTAAVIGTAAERRAMIDALSEYDVIITSYASLVRDMELYEDKHFGLHFIDEAQFIKNHTTQSSKAVKAIKSDIRFALTGTPVENTLAELWSIFDFIMPDYLFGYAHFKTQFEQPIVKKSDNSAVTLLKKMTAPFILRRMKKDVLSELPEKTETTLAAEMTEEQKKLYLANLLSLKGKLSESENLNVDGARFQVLAMLTRLRQICCDPALIYDNYEGGSAKTEQCIQLLESCIAAGHKVLLFSQFTSMLDIVMKRLDAIGLSYFTLTGKTKPRERLSLVNRFNKDDTQVFLISLKAGGTGLNLTGADIVIHFDPWWNLSAENQASDRTYRIGQKNNVQVYKLIAQNTIEEKIQELQKSKSELAELALNSDSDITKMSAGDIMELIK